MNRITPQMTRLLVLARLGLFAVLTASLAACVDAEVDVTLTGQNTATASLVETMGADFYTLVKMNRERKDDDPRKADEFCADGTLAETKDGGATCTVTQDGRFAALHLGSPDQMLEFSRVAPDRVRVSLPLAGLKAGLGPADDEQSATVLSAFFAGHTLTVRFAGARVIASNMDIAEDETSAQRVVQFSDLLAGTGDLPDELYAIIEAP